MKFYISVNFVIMHEINKLFTPECYLIINKIASVISSVYSVRSCDSKLKGAVNP